MIEIYKLDVVERNRLYLHSTHFNIHYNQTKDYLSVYTTLEQLVGGKYRKELWCVVTNTARALKHKSKSLSAPTVWSAYTDNKQELSSKRMRHVLSELTRFGFFTYYKGGFINVKKNEYVQSVYVFTPIMLDLWFGVDISKESSDVDAVQIKDRETKDVKSTRRVGGVADMRKVMDKYNELLCSVDLTLDNQQLPVQQYTRIFCDSLELGGRLYNVVGGVQTMKQEDRKRLKINGEDVCELDFKALHPSILYDKLYQQLPEIVDVWLEKAWGGEYNPYKHDDLESLIEIDYNAIEHYKIRHNKPTYNPARNLMKVAVMISLNAMPHDKDESKRAYSSLAKEIAEDRLADEKDMRYYGLQAKINNVGKRVFPSKKVCELVQAVNMPLAKYFFSDTGIKLQRIDSDIMAYVVQKLADVGEALYPEHDSVIVRKSLKEQAEVFMREAYKSVVGSDKFCFIEEK